MVDNNYRNKEQLSNGVWVVPDGNKKWGGELNHNFELLNDLLTNYTLTVKQNGTTVATFDRTADVTANIDTVYPTNDQVDILFPGYQGEPVSSETPNEKTEVNYSSLIRYTNNLKSVVVTDVSLNENTMTFKYLNNNTKDIELPVSQSSGTELPTKSVTRIPVYLELNFFISGDENEKLSLTTAFVRDLVKVYKRVGTIVYPVEIKNVTDVTREKSQHDYESVFLVEVGVTPTDFHGLGGTLVLVVGDSFGNLTVQSEAIKAGINAYITDYNDTVVQDDWKELVTQNTFTGQVVATEGSTMELLKQSQGSHDNHFYIDACIETKNMNDEHGIIKNNGVSWFKNMCTFAFTVSLQHTGLDDTEKTFTVYDL